MPLVTMNEILPAARRAGKAIGAFNAANYETAVAVIQAAEAEKSPVILQVYSRMFGNGKAEALGGLLIRLAQKCSQPVALHLDHGENLEQVRNALDWGYNSIMLDGSRLPYADNVAATAAAGPHALRRGRAEGEGGGAALADRGGAHPEPVAPVPGCPGGFGCERGSA